LAYLGAIGCQNERCREFKAVQQEINTAFNRLIGFDAVRELLFLCFRRLWG
jgi:hypothetical protein